jgi:Kinetochore complex Sim4 subunit Fta1
VVKMYQLKEDASTSCWTQRPALGAELVVIAERPLRRREEQPHSKTPINKYSRLCRSTNAVFSVDPMDDGLYDTSFTLYTVTDTSLPYRNLLQSHQGALHARATRLREHLSCRPKYEDEEEKEKIGGLRDCTWLAIRNPQRRSGDADGVAVILTYDKAIYKFMLFSNASTARTGTTVEIPLLLAKASATNARLFVSFLAENFHVTINPLKLPPDFVSSTISSYVSQLHSAFKSVSDTTSMVSLLKDTMANLKLSVTANIGSANGADIAQHLRTIDIDVPAETLYQLFDSAPSQPQTNGSTQPIFLSSLQHHIHQRTGLILPLLLKDATADATDEPPLKLSRVASLSFALSTEGRLKFNSRAIEAVEAIPGLESGENNVVRKANAQLLEALVTEAMKNG